MESWSQLPGAELLQDLFGGWPGQARLALHGVSFEPADDRIDVQVSISGEREGPFSDLNVLVSLRLSGIRSVDLPLEAAGLLALDVEKRSGSLAMAFDFGTERGEILFESASVEIDRLGPEAGASESPRFRYASRSK